MTEITSAKWSHFSNLNSENNGKESSENEVLSPEGADEGKLRLNLRIALGNDRPNNCALKREKYKLIEFWH